MILILQVLEGMLYEELTIVGLNNINSAPMMAISDNNSKSQFFL